ncbi:hypothetical protein [Micromonospora sp. NPDC003776]
MYLTTRSGSGVDNSWSQFTQIKGEGRPYPLDADVTYSPDHRESYQMWTWAGARPVTPLPGLGELAFVWRKADGTQPAGVDGLSVNVNPTPSFERISTTMVDRRLHICGVAYGGAWGDGANNGDIVVNAREEDPDLHYSATYQFLQAWHYVESVAGHRDFVDVACATVFNPATATEDLHLFGVTRDGHLLRTVHTGPITGPISGSSKGKWRGWWEDMKVVWGGGLGKVVRVDATSRYHRDQLAVVAVTDDGRAWYTGTSNSGTWTTPRDIVAGVNAVTAPISQVINVDDVAIAFCDANVPHRVGSESDWELNIVLRSSDKKQLLHTVLAGVSTQWATVGPGSSPSLWKPFVDLLDAAMYTDLSGRKYLSGFAVGEQPYPATPPPSAS